MPQAAEPAIIDLLSPASFDGGQPHEQFRWLRATAPVYRHPEPDGPGFWAVTRYEDVRAVGRDPVTFSSEPTVMIPDVDQAIGIGDHKMMLMSDPPYHTRLRRVINSQFTPKAVQQLRPRIQELAGRIIDAVAGRGECDLVDDIAGEMPSYVIAELMGIPLEDGRRLYQLTETIHAAPGAVAEGAAMAAVLEMFTYAHGVREDKLGRPGDDLASRIIGAEVDGHQLDEIDFNLFFLLLIDAGGDTTRNLVAVGMDVLFEHPAELRRLHGDLDRLLPSAIEELLRWVSPVVYMRRTATRDTELAGTPIAAGDKVVMYYGSANRDETAFADADRLDVGRSPNEHVAFGGGGPHFCLGSHIARMEIDAVLRELLTRLPDIHPEGPAQWLASNFISGLKHRPVRFAKRPPRGAGSPTG